METTITAVYENGVLRPLTPLVLPEHVEVEISIRTQTPGLADVEEHHRRLRAILVAAGLALPIDNAASTAEGLLSEERNAVAQHMPAGKPLSEIIREEREER